MTRELDLKKKLQILMSLAAGDRDSHRAICRHVLARFGQTDQLAVANHVARACCHVEQTAPAREYGLLHHITPPALIAPKRHEPIHQIVATGDSIENASNQSKKFSKNPK